MLEGNKDRFAIEAQPEEYPKGWILGRFRFWIGGEPVGNWDDWADLKGCVHWLRNFVEVPRNRVEPRLDSLEAAGVFKLVYDPVYVWGAGTADPEVEPIPDASDRFHLSHLGMSSFERFDIVLIKTPSGNERCLWRSTDDPRIREVRFEPGEMERVAKEFCDRFEREIVAPSAAPA